ncbi:DNA polymerase III subunit delta' [Sulfurimonas sp. SAG-AH-194-I05]|nr:DNA polymerase III subunit delta' [Sulfurimonas sp. SAG-AH-194-I05]MDF1874368.1 DNA polymerase III subunit delta' [Sulfurimonas sp. SAG-AH-194-I05]
MLLHENKKSHIVLSSEIEAYFEKLQEELSPHRVIGFLEETEFKLDNAKAVIKEAYISESQTKYLVLGANSFNSVSQNSLLKILEEPPKNIEIIIITPSKSNLLATVRSRLPIVKGDVNHEAPKIDLNLLRIDYAHVFTFLKANVRVSKVDAKQLVEAIYYRATVVDKLLLSKKQLNNFDMAYRLLELNSKPQNVFSMLLMSFVGER